LFREALSRLNALDDTEIATFSFERRATTRTGLSLNH